jgi:hypothetical protein
LTGAVSGPDVGKEAMVSRDRLKTLHGPASIRPDFVKERVRRETAFFPISLERKGDISMKRRLVFISSMLLTLATSTIAFATVADAAVVRHHFVHLTVAHGGHAHAAHGRHAGHGGWVGRDWTGDNWGSNYGRMDSDYNGYGSYHGYAGGFCGTIAWTLDLCGPHGP